MISINYLRKLTCYGGLLQGSLFLKVHCSYSLALTYDKLNSEILNMNTIQPKYSSTSNAHIEIHHIPKPLFKFRGLKMCQYLKIMCSNFSQT